MSRIAFTMRLKPGAAAAYRQAHDAIWPELLDLMKQSNIRNYSIFQGGLDLFAYLEADDENVIQGPQNPIVLEWWRTLEPLLETDATGRPVQTPLQEVFHAD